MKSWNKALKYRIRQSRCVIGMQNFWQISIFLCLRKSFCVFINKKLLLFTVFLKHGYYYRLISINKQKQIRVIEFKKQQK